jgi:tagaturonate reductase
MVNKVTFLQFGTGKFIKAYFDWMLSKIDSDIEVFATYFTSKQQYIELKNNNCEYNVILKDKDSVQIDTVKVIKDVFFVKDAETMLELTHNTNFIVSNTTEKGILSKDNEKESYPFILTSFLYEKFKIHNDQTITIVPLELIFNNGDFLKKSVLNLAQKYFENSFREWVIKTCEFVNTLVDCIVVKENNLNIEREKYYAFYSSHNSLLETLFSEKNLNIYFTQDIDKIAQIKIRVLNGIHTFLATTAFLEGKSTVYECLLDKNYANLIDEIFYNEILPTIDYDKHFAEDFYIKTINRFKNPHIEHYLKDIAENTYEKFYERIAKTIIDYEKIYNKKPKILMKAFYNLKKMYPNNDNVNSFERYIESFANEKS